MRCLRLFPQILMVCCFGCQTNTELEGVWQSNVCSQTTCSAGLKLHLGQYGHAVSGISTWHRRVEGIDTYHSPNYWCGCQYIEVGTWRDGHLRLRSLPHQGPCVPDEHCAPCGCATYTIELSRQEEERLIGKVKCEDGHSVTVELERVLESPVRQCDQGNYQ